MTTDEAIIVLRRMLRTWSNQDDYGPTQAEAEQAVLVVGLAAEDMRVAAGECRVSLPDPGTDAARLLCGNNLLRSALRRSEHDAIEAHAENDELVRQRDDEARRAADAVKALDMLWDEVRDPGRCAHEVAPGLYAHTTSLPCRKMVSRILFGEEDAPRK